MDYKLNLKTVLGQGDPQQPVQFALQKGDNLIGRWDPDSASFPEIDLSPYDPEVKISRKHAVIEFVDSGIFIRDLGSLNGTFLKDRLQEDTRLPLSLGAQFSIGPVVLELVNS